MSFLPPVGTVYPSLAHFKLYVYSESVQAIQALKEDTDRFSNPEETSLIRCAFIDPEGDQIERCPVKVLCKKLSEQKFVVVSRSIEHLCGIEGGFPQSSSTRSWMLKMRSEQAKVVAALESAWRNKVPVLKASSTLMRRGRSIGGDHFLKRSTDDHRSEGGAVNDRITPTPRCPSETLATVGRRFEASEGFFPQAGSLRKRIDELKSASLQLPLADETFSGIDEILSRLYAFSQQQGVLLERCTTTATSTHKELLCSHNYREYEQVRGGRCSVVYRIDQARDGNWSLAYPVQPHSHPVFEEHTSSSSAAISESSSSQSSPVQNETSRLPRSSSSESSTLVQSPPTLALDQTFEVPRVCHSSHSSKPSPSPFPTVTPSSRGSISPPSFFGLPPSKTSLKRKFEDPIQPPPATTESPQLSPHSEEQHLSSDPVSKKSKLTELHKEEAQLQKDSTSSGVSSNQQPPAENPLPTSTRSTSANSTISTPSPQSLSLVDSQGEEESDELPSIELPTFLQGFNLSDEQLSSTLSDLRVHGCDSIDTLVTLLCIEHSPTFDGWAGGLEEEGTKKLVKDMRNDFERFELVN